MNELRSLADLLDLQALDSAIDALLEQRSSLPELDRFKAAHEESVARKATLGQVEAEHVEISRALDKAEGELEIAEEKARITEQRLYAGGMNARETEHMRADVAQLAQQTSAMEDEVLALIDRKEELDASVNDARAAHTKVTETKKALESAIAVAWRKIDAELARKEARKAELVPGIDPELVEAYEETREHRGGVAVGALEGSVCGSCHVEMSPGEVARLKKEDLPRCVHCYRLLVI